VQLAQAGHGLLHRVAGRELRDLVLVAGVPAGRDLLEDHLLGHA